MSQSLYLVHHGIKGQKWGVRRFRNEDGTLTNAGKERYREKYWTDERKRTAKRVLAGVGAVAAVAVVSYGAYKVGKNYINARRLDDLSVDFDRHTIVIRELEQDRERADRMIDDSDRVYRRIGKHLPALREAKDHERVAAIQDELHYVDEIARNAARERNSADRRIAIGEKERQQVIDAIKEITDNESTLDEFIRKHFQQRILPDE